MEIGRQVEKRERGTTIFQSFTILQGQKRSKRKKPLGKRNRPAAKGRAIDAQS
jgi:hypothetical protein